ncbi:hypothetical protein ACLBYD_24080 [Rhodococcus sp. C26F]|jgi:hypothetical protein|uniref:hypothetical protein n=2 Tax=Nocardiaceae TaxID=85025 RepID=UPI0022840E50|nr:hypothetical protein [Rhodococcus pyridinivorans]WAL49712.1 hypothetical protein OQN32_27255 [Rhodococcus pyridinivorans]
MSDPRPKLVRPNRARGKTGFFVPVVKDFWKEMAAEGCSFSEIGYFALILTSKATTPVGSLYLQHEWGDIEGTNPDHAEKSLDSLERRGKIVRDGYYILVRSWIRRNCFTNPNYLKAGLYPLQNDIDSPLLRFVIGSELLRLDLSSLEPTKAQNLHASASLLWAEITESELPPPNAMTGDLNHPNDYMIGALATMPGIDSAAAELDRRNWCVVKEELRVPLQKALAQVRNVTPFQARMHAQ